MAERIARSVLELTTDKTGLDRGLADAEKAVGGFSGRVSALSSGIKGFAKEHEQSFKAVGAAAGILGGALVAAGAGIIALGQRGAVVADVRSQFNSLTASVGGTADAMIGALRRGVVGTVSDFELMKLANKALGTGLVKTSEDFETLSAGARLLAKRTGGETTEAFETLTTAMASGRTAQLKQLGVFVDSKEAVEQFAKANRMSVGDLNDAQRAQALSAAALAALREELRKNAPDMADFGERIDQGKTRLLNFKDSLAEAVANSPAIAAAFDGIGSAIDSAFGGDQAQLVQTLTGYVNSFAIGAATTAQVIASGAGIIVRAWEGLKLIFSGVALAIAGLAEGVIKGFAAIVNAANQIPGVRGTFTELGASLDSAGAFAEGMRQSFQDQAAEAWEGVKGNSALGQTIDKLGVALGETKAKMISAAAATTTQATATRGLARGQDDAEQSSKALASAQAAAKKAADEAAKKLEEQRRALSALGVVTDRDVNTALAEFQQIQKTATAEGVSMRVFLEAVLPKLEDLARKAKASGVESHDLADSIRDVRAALAELHGAPPMLDPSKVRTGAAAVEHVVGLFPQISAGSLEAARDAAILQGAHETLGITSRDELVRTARAARQAYEDMTAAGWDSAEQEMDARHAVEEAEIAAGLRSRSRWRAFWGDYLDRAKSAFSELSRGFAATLLGMSGSLHQEHRRAAEDTERLYTETQQRTSETLSRTQAEARRKYDETDARARDSFERTKKDALERFEAMRASGDYTAEELEHYWIQMNLAMKEDSDRTDAEIEAAHQAMLEEIEEAEKTTNGELEQAHAEMLKAKEEASHRWRDNMKELWGQLKLAFGSILTDMLSDFTNRFLRGMLNAVMGAQGGFSSAFAGLFGIGGGAGGGGSSSLFANFGRISGSSWANAFTSIANAAVWAWVGWELAGAFLSWIGGGSAPRDSQQDVVRDSNTGEIIYDPSDPNNPNPGGPDPGQPNPDGTMPGDGDNGQRGFAFGTPELDFLRFRPGGERVRVGEGGIPEAIIPQGRGHELAAEIAAALGPALAGSREAPTVHVYVGGEEVSKVLRLEWRRNAAERREALVTLNA